MKKHNKFLSVLLTATLMFGLVACGNAENEDSTKNSVNGNGEQTEASESAGEVNGRFIESQVELPEGIAEIKGIAKLSDGSLEAAAVSSQTGKDCLLTSADEGGNWQVKEIESLNANYITNVAIRNDGTVAYVGYFNEDEAKEGTDIMGTEGLKLVSKDGNVQKVDFALPQSEDTSAESGMVTQMAFDEDGNLIIQDLQSRFFAVNTETGELTELYSGDGEYIPYFGTAGNRVYAVSESGMKIFSGKDGSMAEEDSVLNEMAKKNAEPTAILGYLPVIMTKGMEENSLVYANHEGVYYHSENGSVSEQLINGEFCSLSDTTLALAGIVMLNEKSYLISALDSMGNVKLLKYIYDENASSVPEKQLQVYALEDSNLLRQAIAVFQAKNPDTFVQVEIGISEENGVTTEDALRTLNTEILAGKGPDILILDGMPVDSYVEKGILADIKSILDEVESADGMFVNIKNAYEDNGSIYCMPCRFKISLIAGSNEAVETGNVEGLLNYGKTIKEEGKKVFSVNGAANMLEELFQIKSAGWLNEEGAIEQSKLEMYLKTAKEMYDLNGNSQTAGNEEVYTFSTTNGYNLGTFSAYGIERLTKKSRISFGTLANIYELKDMLSIEKQLDGTYGMFINEEAKSFVPYLMAGVVSGKEGEQQVQEFMKTIFGKECGMQSESGFPTNRAAYEALCQRELENAENGEEVSVEFSTEEGTMTTYTVCNLTQEDLDSLTEKLESMTTPVITDSIIRDLIITEGCKYLEGEQSLEETSGAIMQKVNLYLSE